MTKIVLYLLHEYSKAFVQQPVVKPAVQPVTHPVVQPDVEACMATTGVFRVVSPFVRASKRLNRSKCSLGE